MRKILKSTYCLSAMLACSVGWGSDHEGSLSAGNWPELVKYFEKPVVAIHLPEGAHLNPILSQFFISAQRVGALFATSFSSKSAVQKIEVIESSRGIEGSYFSWDGTLRLSTWVCSKNLNRSKDSNLLAGWVHEVTHSFAQPIFLQNFNSEIFESRESLRVLKNFRQYPTFTDKDLDQHRLPVLAILEPFDELIADAVAVLVLEDPDAMKKAIQGCRFDNPRMYRTFRSTTPTWNYKVFDSLFAERHVVMNPSRSVIWSSYKASAKDQCDKAAILKASVNASIEQAQEIQAKRLTLLDWRNYNFALLNQSWIRNFQRELTLGKLRGERSQCLNSLESAN